jgi:hypothetical protein
MQVLRGEYALRTSSSGVHLSSFSLVIRVLQVTDDAWSAGKITPSVHHLLRVPRVALANPQVVHTISRRFTQALLRTFSGKSSKLV